MKTPVRKAAAVLGIGILGCVVVAVIALTHSLPMGNEGLNLDRGARPGDGTHAEEAPGKSGGGAATPVEREPEGRTKSKERPSATELARQRLERRRLELEEALEKYKGAGMGGRHPDVVKAMAELEKMEAEQAAAGDGDKPAH